MRARYPDEQGKIERNGATIGFERFGHAPRTVLLLPTWSIIHTRFWKAQVPFLARRFRVVTFDAVGNGMSDRPLDPARHSDRETALDAFAILDHLGIEHAGVVALSRGARYAAEMAAIGPERIEALALIGPGLSPTPIAEEEWSQRIADRQIPKDRYEPLEGNIHSWRDDFHGFLEAFMNAVFPEPHSTKQVEDAIGWGLETSPDALFASIISPFLDGNAHLEALAALTCPKLLIHGTEDAIVPFTFGEAVAERIDAALLPMEGSGHNSNVRHPIAVNLALRSLLDPGALPNLVRFGTRRSKRALFVSSPIGLGHARRDVAIARELRAMRPGLQIDWLAQDPVTRVLEAEGERIHPASGFLALESAHIESESAEHDLHAFQALRRMDEILVNNFHVFHDVAEEGDYDLWIGDEAWELDYFLHENPNLKRAAYCWLTDFVGWVPMESGGEHERFLTRDYNAEMIEHIARFPRLRDRAVFVGRDEDVVPLPFGDGLPLIRDWVGEHFSYSGYITGFDPNEVADIDALRAELGFGRDEKVCVVTVGGSGVGAPLLRRVIEALPTARDAVPGLRMVAVTGPRIDPASFPSVEGLDVRPYVHRLYRHLAACDLAIVQGGLTTTMELAANGRPFIYVPLRNHFEQNIHVRHRLDRYRAGRCMDYDACTPEALAREMVQALKEPPRSLPVETDGAARAAAHIAGLI